MSKAMPITEVNDAIMSATEYFRLKFVKSDGSIVERMCKPRIKHRGEGNKPTANSDFKYNLRDKYSLLLDVQGSATPRTVKAFAILEFRDVTNIWF